MTASDCDADSSGPAVGRTNSVRRSRSRDDRLEERDMAGEGGSALRGLP